MKLLTIFLGLAALFLAWALLFRKHLVFTLNRWMREYAFSDQWVLFSGQRIAVLLLVLGGLSIFSGLETSMREKSISPKMVDEVMVQAKKEFQANNFNLVVSRCKAITKVEPRNLVAREYLAASWFHLNEPHKASREVEVILGIDPAHKFDQGPLRTFVIRNP